MFAEKMDGDEELEVTFGGSQVFAPATNLVPESMHHAELEGIQDVNMVNVQSYVTVANEAGSFAVTQGVGLPVPPTQAQNEAYRTDGSHHENLPGVSLRYEEDMEMLQEVLGIDLSVDIDTQINRKMDGLYTIIHSFHLATSYFDFMYA